MRRVYTADSQKRLYFIGATVRVALIAACAYNIKILFKTSKLRVKFIPFYP